MSEAKFDRTPPQDVAAEQGVLGGIMLSPDAMSECRAVLSDDDWYRPAHQLIWRTACHLHDRGEPVDGITIAAQLVDSGEIGKVGGHPYLHTLISGVPTAANAGYYAQIVAEKAVLRQLVVAGTRIVQMAYGADDGAGMSGTVADVVDRAEVEMQIASTMASTGRLPEGLMTWRDFIDTHSAELRRWVVQGLIAEQDVIMVLAPPGAGKTTLSRQMALAIAAGIHPFRPLIKIEPLTTLLIDLEVDPSTAAEETAGPYSAIARYGDLQEQRAWIWSHIEGVNLRKPADARLFESVIAEIRPKFVAIGSLYKTGVQARGGESHEVAANEVREVLDRLRRRYRFALWIEHHMPKAQGGGRAKNPFGSSVWEWWPSHGRVLERAVDGNAGSPFTFSAPFRGDRGARDLPVGFTRGGRLPWTEIVDQAELELLIGAAGG